ncbi:MAG TPA: hypothetical protein VN033_12955 [Vulgatibacter sp.]|nr:hypothetical protein [Vulgatibacter sp.]
MSARVRFGITLALLSAVGAAWACGEATGTEALTLKSFHGLRATKDGCFHTEQPIVGGIYDVDLAMDGGGDFGIYIQLVNNLKSNENLGAGRLNSNQVKVTEIEIAYDRIGPWDFLPEAVSIPAGIVVETGERHFAPIGAIPQSIATAIHDRPEIFENGFVPLRLWVMAKGELFDGTEAKSNDLAYTIDLCSGCLRPDPCGGGPVEAVCASAAQPDGWACAKTTPGGNGGGGAGGD